ncbi:MAG: GNAT family N-acetyltransferase [Marinovum sp.]|nr:GNAT family N-acetyltransferase [Marinovum sp.]
MYEVDAVGLNDRDTCIIWRFMVERRHQNKGIGRVAMGLILAEIKSQGTCQMVTICYDAQNPAASTLYTAFGFQQAGCRDDGVSLRSF